MVLVVLTGYLLGLCMDTMEPEEDIGGWLRTSIMKLINIGMEYSAPNFLSLEHGLVVSGKDAFFQNDTIKMSSSFEGGR